MLMLIDLTGNKVCFKCRSILRNILCSVGSIRQSKWLDKNIVISTAHYLNHQHIMVL